MASEAGVMSTTRCTLNRTSGVSRAIGTLLEILPLGLPDAMSVDKLYHASGSLAEAGTEIEGVCAEKLVTMADQSCEALLGKGGGCKFADERVCQELAGGRT